MLSFGIIVCLYFIHQPSAKLLANMNRYNIFIVNVLKYFTHAMLFCNRQPEIYNLIVKCFLTILPISTYIFRTAFDKFQHSTLPSIFPPGNCTSHKGFGRILLTAWDVKTATRTYRNASTSSIPFSTAICMGVTCFSLATFTSAPFLIR